MHEYKVKRKLVERSKKTKGTFARPSHIHVDRTVNVTVIGLTQWEHVVVLTNGGIENLLAACRTQMTAFTGEDYKVQMYVNLVKQLEEALSEKLPVKDA